MALILILTLLVAPKAGALDPERSITQYKHTRWTAAEGAPPIIYALAQGADGYLWIGSADGLYRFDGVTFEHIKPRDPEVNAWRPMSLLVARDGTIWVGYHSGAIAAYRNGVLRVDRSAPRRESYVASLTQTRDGAIWAAYANRNRWLFRRGTDGRWADISGNWDAPTKASPALFFAARDGSLWVAVNRAIFVQRAGTSRFERVASHEGRPSISEDPSGRIWLSDKRGSRILSGTPADLAGAVFPTPGFPIWVAHTAFDRDGNLWVVNGQGLFRLRTPGDALALPADARAARVERLTAKDGLTADTTTPLIEDREGNIWVGTTLGLDQFRNVSVVSEPKFATTPPSGFGLLRSSDGAVYVGTGDTVYRVAPGGQPQAVAEHVANPNLICEGAGGTIWAFTDAQRIRITRGGVKRMPAPDIAAIRAGRAVLTTCALDNRGVLWVSAQEAGSFTTTSGEVWQHHPPIQENVWFQDIVPEKNGRLIAWLTSGILTRVDANGQPDQVVLRGLLSTAPFTYQGRHDLLVGGSFGIGRVRQGALQSLDRERFPALADANGLVETPEGQTWLISKAGIVGVGTADLERAFGDPRTHLNQTILSFEDGLPNVRAFNGQIPMVRGGDGRIWFVTVTGVAWVDPARLARNPVPPPVRIRALVADGQRYRDPAQLTLAKGTSNLAIQYAGLSLTIPQRVRFRYRLEGVDRNWVDAGARREAYYTNLGPGTYRFRVIAENNDGIWNREGATLTITIPPTFLQSIWFKLICALVIGTLGWVAYALRVRQLEARLQSHYQVRIAERERIARELHDTLLQSVNGLMLFIQSISYRMPADSGLREPIEKALDRAGAALVEGRDRVHELRSDAASHDLAHALRDTAGDIIAGDAPGFRLTVQGVQQPLDALVSEELLRIAEEAIRNAAQHASPNAIEAILTFGRRHLRLAIQDDGSGISEAILKAGGRDGHYGLVGMRERAQRIGGRLAVSSRAGAGTTVMVSVPARAAYRQRCVTPLGRLRLRRPVA